MTHFVTMILQELLNPLARRMGVRSGCRAAGNVLLALVAAAFVAIYVLSCVQAGKGTLPAWEVLARGGSWAILLPPAFALGTIALLVRRAPGNAWYLVLASGATNAVLWVTLALGKALLPAGLVFSGGAALALILGLVHWLLTFVLASGQAVPLNDPLAGLVYLGRAGHLRALYRMAQQHAWPVQGPEGPQHALTVQGRYGERAVYIESGAHMSMSSVDPGYAFLKVSVYSTRRLWPLIVQTGLPDRDRLQAYQRATSVHEAPWLADAQAVDLPCQLGRGTVARLWAPPGVQVAPASLGWVVRAIEQAPFMNNGRMWYSKRTLFAHGDGLRWERRHGVRLTETEDDVERIIAWVAGVVSAMEEAGFATERLPDASAVHTAESRGYNTLPCNPLPARDQA